MTLQRLARALALSATLLAAPGARAMDVTGALDTGYTRTDTWGTGQPTTAVPAWDYGGNFNLSGSPLRPGLLSLDGGAEYRKIQNYYSAAPGDTSDWGYHGTARLFSDSPFNLTLSGNRGWYDFSSQLNSPGLPSIQATGNTFYRGESVDAQYQMGSGLPTLHASLGQTSTDNTSFGQGLNTTSDTFLSAGAAQTIGVHSYDLSYYTDRSTGTYADTNYSSHLLNFADDSKFSDNLELRFLERYFLRDPTVGSDVNPRIDDNTLSSGLYFRPSSLLQGTVSYNYHQMVAEAPGMDGRESLNHGLSGGTEYLYSKRITFLTNVGVNYDSERLGSASYTGTGEQVGGGIRFSDKLS